MPPILAPSLLAANHARLAEGLALVEKSGARWVHLDIMDGHFVPNLSFGPATVAALRTESKLFFDVHLMLDNAHHFVEPFAKAGADLISLHVEPYHDLHNALRAVKALGCQRGLALNPGTPFDLARPFLKDIELLLLMTVQPGFGGQSFREDVLPKIRLASKTRAELGLDYRIEVDGGIDRNTLPNVREAGADTFVAGTAFFKDPSPAEFCIRAES
jgi:ribulose-phosphate 3-epimerase